MSDQTADIKPFTLMLMSNLQSGATEARVYHAAQVDTARAQVDAQHAKEVARLTAERDTAQQEIQTLEEGLTWALDALEAMMRDSPLPPLPSEAPMTETPTDVTAILARPMRVALAAYYDAKRALAQVEADDHALMGRTVRVLTDAEVLDAYERMLGRR